MAFEKRTWGAKSQVVAPKSRNWTMASGSGEKENTKDRNKGEVHLLVVSEQVASEQLKICNWINDALLQRIYSFRRSHIQSVFHLV